MAKRQEIPVGTRFGKWTVLGEAGMRGDRRMIRVACPHGETTAQADNLLAGRSSGCVLCGHDVHRTHQLSGTAEYRVAMLAILRCTDPRTNDFEHYGGKSAPVTVHPDWHTPDNLGVGAARMAKYLLDTKTIGRRPSSTHQIDRIDNNRGYEPGNLRWVTASENCRNRSDNRVITHNGQTRCVAEWSEITGIGHTTILYRISVGDPAWLALTPKSEYQRLKKELKSLNRQQEAA